MRKCVNCPWKGTEEETKNQNFCPICGDNTEADGETSPLDLDGDGDFDKDDTRIAGRVLAKARSLKKGKR